MTPSTLASASVPSDKNIILGDIEATVGGGESGWEAESVQRPYTPIHVVSRAVLTAVPQGGADNKEAAGKGEGVGDGGTERGTDGEARREFDCDCHFDLLLKVYRGTEAHPRGGKLSGRSFHNHVVRPEPLRRLGGQ